MCPQWDCVPMITDPCTCTRSQQDNTADERESSGG